MIQSKRSLSGYYSCFHSLLHTDEDPMFAESRIVVIFVEKGTATLSVNDKEYRISEHIMLFLHSNKKLRLIKASSDFRIFGISFMRSVLHEVGQRLESNFFALVFSKVCWYVMPSARETLQGFCRMFEYCCQDKVNPFREEMLRSLIGLYVKGMYGLLLQYYPEMKSYDTLRVQNLFKRFMQCVNTHYSSEHGVGYYADQLCISTRYLTQITRKIVNKTPKTLIDYKLLISALTLLSRTDKTIQEVSDLLGFQDQSYFTRFFKRCLGVTPMFYRAHPEQVEVPAFEDFG